MAHFTLLDQAAEDKLHSTRLLNIEERPFKRITKRLLAPSTPITSYLSRTATDAPNKTATTSSQNADETVSDAETSAPSPTTLDPEAQAKFLKDLNRFREDLILDFAAFDSSIARIQFLYLANAKQRQRYAEEKIKIQSTSDEVREDMERLKVRLEEAQKTLQVRKGYDVLAEKITKNKDLKARDEQQVNIERLRAEIEELEREGVELGNSWVERREQFGRVVEEGARLRRVVRGEPEPEVKDENDEDEGDVADGDGDGDGEDGRSDVDGDENMLGMERQRDRDGHSNVGTPRPSGDGEDAPTPLPGGHESGAMTPRSTIADHEALTPRPGAGASESKDDHGDAEMKDEVPEVRIDDMDTT